MRRPKTIPSPRLALRRGKPEAPVSISKQAEELMELAVEAAQSRHLPDFLERFAQRCARMLDANWGGVAVYRGRETELYSSSADSNPDFVAVEGWLITTARGSAGDVETLAIPKEIGATFQDTAESTTAVLVRIAASDNERLGTLCLLRKRKNLDANE